MSQPISFYSFNATDINGVDVSMDQFNGRVLLVVNTASKGNGKHIIKKLVKLQNKYGERGFTVLAFPCRQFLHQEHKQNEKIRNSYICKRNVNFPVFARVKVNGKRAHPMFKWLKRKKQGPLGKMIGWSFTKFLIYSDGMKVKRFESSSDWSKMEKKIEAALTDREWRQNAKARIERLNEDAASPQQSYEVPSIDVVPPEAIVPIPNDCNCQDETNEEFVESIPNNTQIDMVSDGDGPQPILITTTSKVESQPAIISTTVQDGGYERIIVTDVEHAMLDEDAIECQE